MSKIDELELSNLSDEERAALADEEVGSLDDAEKAARSAEAINDDDTPPAAPDTPAAASEEDEPDSGPLAPRLMPPALDGHDEQLATLLDQRKTIREQYRNGDISAEDRERQEDELNERIADLRAARQNAQFVENFNTQMAEQEYLTTVARVKADILERDGIDYDKNRTLLQSWDLKVKTLAMDPANASKPADWYLKEGHKQVIAELEAAGFRREARSGPRDPVREALAGRRPADTRARSLATLPIAAQDTGHEGAEFSHLDQLTGDDLETAVARMSPEQQERWARL